MKRILIFIFTVLISINLFSSTDFNPKDFNPTDSNSNLLTNLQQYLQTGKNTLEKVEELIKKISIVDGKLIIKGISSHEDIELLLKFINDNPALYETFSQLLNPQKTCAQRILQRLTAISPQTLHAAKWATIGSLLTVISTMGINSMVSPNICSSFPTGNLLNLTLYSGLFGAWLIFKYIKIPTSWYLTFGLKALNLTSHLLPYIGKGVANLISHGQLHNNNPKSRKAFQELYKSIGPFQKDLVSIPSVLLTAVINPCILIKEPKFLNSLNEHQNNLVCCIFKNIKEKENFDNFEKFANTLTNEQVEFLYPKNKLVLAQYCPQLLLEEENNEFIKNLNAEQTELLGNYIQLKSTVSFTQ